MMSLLVIKEYLVLVYLAQNLFIDCCVLLENGEDSVAFVDANDSLLIDFLNLLSIVNRKTNGLKLEQVDF